ncbi:MAG TPA: M48 family peptidase [Deltaproteobacteria bacterium]|nr:M48 family peptidase [Deltaproteobacteria bacterium]
MNNPSLLLLVFLALYALHVFTRVFLQILNRSSLKLHGHEIPGVFSGVVDVETLKKMRDYTLADTSVGSAEELITDIAIIIVMLGGVLPWLLGLDLFQNTHFILSGLMFFLLIGFLLTLLGIPFDLYRTFVIERRFSFSTITASLWLRDLALSLAVSAVLAGILLGGLLGLIHVAPALWWLLAWLFFILFQLLITWIYPVLIAPLFNRFEPIEDRQLTEKITDTFHRAGLQVKGIYMMDAGKRSRHTNAYFTGIGRTKRIVLYDTLLENHTPDEISVVLAHELGHWKKGHVRLQIALSFLLSLVVLYTAYLLIPNPFIYEAFGLSSVTPYAGLLILAVLFKPVSFFLTPLGSMLSRYFERQADAYALSLSGSPAFLIQALKKLAKDNLSNLHPHPLYAWFYYSHPPLLDRIERLQSTD